MLKKILDSVQGNNDIETLLQIERLEAKVAERMAEIKDGDKNE